MTSLIKYFSIDITNGKKQGFHLLDKCVAEARTLAVVGTAGDDPVALTPAMAMATSRNVRCKRCCIQGPSRSSWLSPHEALISKCFTNKGLFLVPDIALTQLTTFSWSAGCLLAGKWWHRLSREYGKLHCQLLGHSSGSKERQLLAEELKTFCRNLFVFLHRESFWMQFPAKTKFILEVFLLIICVCEAGGDPWGRRAFKKQKLKSSKLKTVKGGGGKTVSWMGLSCRQHSENQTVTVMGTCPTPHEGARRGVLSHQLSFPCTTMMTRAWGRSAVHLDPNPIWDPGLHPSS